MMQEKDLILQKQYDTCVDQYIILESELKDLIKLRDNVEKTMSQCMLAIVTCREQMKEIDEMIHHVAEEDD